MTPAAAATVVLLDDQSPARIFFVKRHGKSAFMANAYVFPGGRVDPGDGAPSALAHLGGSDGAGLATRMAEIPSANAALAHLVCAARETFEEAGVLLAEAPGGGLPSEASDTALAEARRRLHAGDVAFEALLSRWGLQLMGDSLVYFDHWITPPAETRRFDTRFFVTAAPAGQRYSHDDVETTDSRWLTAAEALAGHEAGTLGLAPPTFWILRQLAALGDAESVLSWAAAREVPAIRPDVRADGSRVIVELDREGRVVWNGTHWTAC